VPSWMAVNLHVKCSDPVGLRTFIYDLNIGNELFTHHKKIQEQLILWKGLGQSFFKSKSVEILLSVDLRTRLEKIYSIIQDTKLPLTTFDVY
jgi:hypothetical protein